MVCFANEAVEGIDPFCATLVSSIVADDWEIVEPEVRITRAQYVSSFADVMNEREQKWGDLSGKTMWSRFGVNEIFQDLAKRLGLEP